LLRYPSRGIWALLVASLSFGSSALFVRFATEASASSLAFYRLSVAALALVMFALWTRNLGLLGKRDLFLVAISGAFLSVHFATFILAVQTTTIANATFLVNTSPVMLAVLSPVLIRERTSLREVIGVVVAILGVLLVAYAGNGFQNFGWGDLSALLAAFFVAIYSLVGRFLRTSGVTTACYTSYVYSIAALVSLVLAEIVGARTFRSYDSTNLFAILGLALVPTLLGHTLYNYSLGSIKTVVANLFPLLEPIVASIFAVLLFNEIPNSTQIAGYGFVIAAVAIVVTSYRQLQEPSHTNTATHSRKPTLG
jgi:drug/metabolite transporter (DMT)-like permease